MTQYDYCQLWSSGSEIGGKFAVIRDGYQTVVRKKSNIEETMEGGLDVQMGGVHKLYAYIIRVRHTELETGYGTYDTLRQLYELNNPLGTPSNVIWHTDHHGTVEQVYMVGDFQGSLLGCQIEGTTAWWDVQVMLRRKQ